MATEMQILALKHDLTDQERMQFDVQMAARERAPSTALILSVLLGYFGVDRFYVGSVGLGLLKLFTGGGFFIWWLIDIFLISGVARRRNLEHANEVKAMMIMLRRAPAAATG